MVVASQDTQHQQNPTNTDMKHNTAAIANLHKDAVIDALHAARLVARKATNADLHAAETAITAAAIVGTLDWVNRLVVDDQHDATLALRLSEVVVAMRDLAPTLADGTEMRAAADRLHLAAMLLFVARRERDLDGRLRAILPLAHDLAAMAEARIEEHADAHPNIATGAGDLDAANAIARLARA